MNKPIGGFFELEDLGNGKGEFHEASFLNTGRACLKLLFQHRAPAKVFIPYYTCDTLIAPIAELKISFAFYSLDELLTPVLPSFLKENEMIVYINYFGLKQNIALQLISSFPNQVIIDNTQAFYSKHIASSFSFNSARKFFGVPDGAYLYGIPEDVSHLPLNTDYSVRHLEDRKKGNQEAAYKEFLAYEANLNCDVKRGSVFSKNILSKVDYEKVAAMRRQNFIHYAEALDRYNMLKLPLTTEAVPFCYPFLPENILQKDKLIEKNIFIPTLWREVLHRATEFESEKDFVERLLPLPIDHRYDENDINFVIEKILKF